MFPLVTEQGCCPDSPARTLNHCIALLNQGLSAYLVRRGLWFLSHHSGGSVFQPLLRACSVKDSAFIISLNSHDRAVRWEQLFFPLYRQGDCPGVVAMQCGRGSLLKPVFLTANYMAVSDVAYFMFSEQFFHILHTVS